MLVVSPLLIGFTLLLVPSISSFANADSPASSIDGPLAFETLPVIETDLSCDALLLWAHGLGDTSKGWKSTVQVMLQHVPYLCAVLPTAHARRVSINGLANKEYPAWYDVTSDDLSRRKQGEGGNSEDMSRSASQLRALAWQESRKRGISPRRVIFGGFSQGAVVALHAALIAPSVDTPELDALRRKQAGADDAGGGPWGGAIAVGGYLGGNSRLAHAAVVAGRRQGKRKAGQQQEEDGGERHDHPWADLRPLQLLRNVTVHVFHGRDDKTVPVDEAERTKDGLLKLGLAQVEVRTFAGVGHGMNDAMLGAVIASLKAMVPPLDADDERDRRSAKRDL